jgi:hypothetical protein
MTRGTKVLVLAAAVAAVECLAQSTDVRRLFYNAPDRPARATKTSMRARAPKKQAVSLPGVEHLGLNYSLMLVDGNCQGGQPVDADRNFKTGEHFKLAIESNASGYLYILSQGTDGNWAPLMPSAEMTGEDNFLNARQRITIPAQHCFTVEPPAGVDRMFLVLARNVQNVSSLSAALRPEPKVEQQPAGRPPRERVEIASVRLNREVEQLRQYALDRNIGITRAEQPSRADEVPHSVFVVNTAGTPVNRLVLEIKIRHE